MNNIHATAVIYEGAQIAEDVVIGPYSVIGPQVTIGKGTIVESHVVIEGETIIGEGNKIYSFASIGKDSQDLKYKGEATKTIIGNNNKIREFVTIHRGTTDRWETRIGDNCLLMAYVHVAHDCIIGNSCILANNATLAGHVVMEDYSYVGGLTPVHQFCKIGTHAFVGGASSINQDIIPFAIAEGAKGGPRAINLIGLKRKGFSEETLKNLKESFRLIFRSNLLLKDAIEQVTTEYGHDENVKKIIDFINNSERGIAR